MLEACSARAWGSGQCSPWPSSPRGPRRGQPVRDRDRPVPRCGQRRRSAKTRPSRCSVPSPSLPSSAGGAGGDHGLIRKQSGSCEQLLLPLRRERPRPVTRWPPPRWSWVRASAGLGGLLLGRVGADRSGADRPRMALAVVLLPAAGIPDHCGSVAAMVGGYLAAVLVAPPSSQPSVRCRQSCSPRRCVLLRSPVGCWQTKACSGAFVGLLSRSAWWPTPGNRFGAAAVVVFARWRCRRWRSGSSRDPRSQSSGRPVSQRQVRADQAQPAVVVVAPAPAVARASGDGRGAGTGAEGVGRLSAGLAGRLVVGLHVGEVSSGAAHAVGRQVADHCATAISVVRAAIGGLVEGVSARNVRGGRSPPPSRRSL